MDGKEFLESAHDLLAIPCERNWRSATGRAYYAVLHEGQAALLRWGFPRPAGEGVHLFVKRRFMFTPHPDLTQFGRTMDRLAQHRNDADYNLMKPGIFRTAMQPAALVAEADAMVALLDTVEADPIRRAAVITALRTRWP